MSNFKNSLESVAAELYSVVRDVKTESSDPLIVESANRAMKRYEKFKQSLEDKATPMLPGYEISEEKTPSTVTEQSLFDTVYNQYI
jgi:hypothetical protein